MKRMFYSGIFFLLITTLSVPCQSQDRIDFDGYWWGTATVEQKIGFIQGFINGSGTMSFIWVASFSNMMSKYASNRNEKNYIEHRFKTFSSWHPYDRSFGFYLERIDAFFLSTKSMKTPVANIMLDLMNPMPD